MPPLYRFIPVFWLALFGLGLAACNSTEPEPVLERTSEPVYDAALAPSSSYPGPNAQPANGYPGYSQPANATPLPTLSGTAVVPTPCNFELPVDTQLVETVFNDWSFSDPYIVSLDRETSSFSIAEWLPDNQHLLGFDSGQEIASVFTIDRNTGITQEYAQYRNPSGEPIWLEADQGVAFVEQTTDQGLVLKVSIGSEQPASIWKTQIYSPYIDDNPGDPQLISALISGEPSLAVSVDSIGQVEQLTPMQFQSIANTESPSFGRTDRLAWSPDGSQLIQYGFEGMYLTNFSTQEICQVNLGAVVERGERWVLYGEWSSDGRYFGMITTTSIRPRPLDNTELTILDFETNRLEVLQPLPIVNSGNYYVKDWAWISNSDKALVNIRVSQSDETPRYGLFLVDMSTLQNQRILPEIEFHGREIGLGMAISPNGEQLAVRCLSEPLCFITITHE